MADPAPARQMNLALMIGGYGGCIGGWRMPGAEYSLQNFPLALHCAELAERAKFDLLFVADIPVAIPERQHLFEALTEIAALGAVTKHIGVAATLSTTYTEPYNAARMLGSVDHMTGGRVAVNIVTTSIAAAAANFGTEAAPKAQRYDMAGEYVEVLKGLWDSWEDDSIIADQASGRLVDPSKLHVLDHQGKYFSVKGPLNMTRPPQGHPVILQAGSSDVGIPFAAQVAEAIFSADPDPESSKAFCADIRRRAASLGRDPSLIRILPGIIPFVAETEAKAREDFEMLKSMIEPEAAWANLTRLLGIDLRGHDPEGPIPDIPQHDMRGYAKAFLKVAERKGFNLRELRDHTAIATHPTPVGTPEMVADELERWFRMGACDGFVVMPPYLPGPFEAFAEGVVPILQKRGLFRTDYTGHTLRHHLGLPRPPHPRAAERGQSAEPTTAKRKEVAAAAPAALVESA